MQDNGGGIPVEYGDKIYDQGFSTKEGQRGYGMYIVKKIVDEFNGTINIDSAEGVLWNITIPMVRRDNLD